MRKFIGLIRVILFRHLTLYATIGVVIAVLFDGRLMMKNINLAVLNRLRPESVEPLVDNTFSTIKLDDYSRYYKKVTEVLPDLADAFGLYGYTLYRQGKTQEAKDAYQNAVKLDPDFFWFHYNLGLLYFHDQQFEKAAESMRKGLSVDKITTFTFIINSPRLYLPLILHQTHDVKSYIVSKYETDLKRAMVVYQVSLQAAAGKMQISSTIPAGQLELTLF